MALAIAVQNDWPLYHFDVKQAFVQAKLDTDVYMKLPCGCGERAGKIVKLERALYGIKQAERQWSAILCQPLEDEHGMEQCRADPCVYRKIVEGVVKLILVVHVDDILVSGEKEACDDWQQGSVTIKQPAMIYTLIKRFNVTAQSDLPPHQPSPT